MNIGIIGAGGFAREVAVQMRDGGLRCAIEYFVDDDFVDESSHALNDFDPSQYAAVIAVADPNLRAAIALRLPSNTRYYSFVHPDAKILGSDVFIGEGAIICAGCILTTNIRIGKHAHLNLCTSVGHDCVIGDFFTTAPGVRVSGNCELGDNVYVGTNAAIRERIRVCSNTVIGMMAGVVKNIDSPGVYVGSPARARSV